MQSRYKLVELATGKVVAYDDDNTVVYGGPYGAVDENGNPKYVWVDNTPSPAEIKAEKIKKLNADYLDYMNQLSIAYAIAVGQKNASNTAEIEAEMASVITQYQAELAAIQAE